MWIQEQSTGKLIDLTGSLAGIGYSGFEEGKNNPALEDQHDVGPLPRGIYTISAPFDSDKHGPYCLRLTPKDGTNTFGRSGFLIHGDSKIHPGMASHGCIIHLHSVRQRIWESGDHELEVVA